MFPAIGRFTAKFVCATQLPIELAMRRRADSGPAYKCISTSKIIEPLCTFQLSFVGWVYTQAYTLSTPQAPAPQMTIQAHEYLKQYPAPLMHCHILSVQIQEMISNHIGYHLA